MQKISCGIQINDQDYQSLTQDERKRLVEIVKNLRATDKLTPEKDLRERAYYKVLTESVPFDR